MKNIVLILTAVFFSYSSMLIAGSPKVEKSSTVSSEIESYLEQSGFTYDSGSATIFTNFIVKENNDLYTIDFMVTEDNELIILSKDLEEEFYRVDHFTSEYMKKHVVPVAKVAS